jgi:hypothetical protein
MRKGLLSSYQNSKIQIEPSKKRLTGFISSKKQTFTNCRDASSIKSYNSFCFIRLATEEGSGSVTASPGLKSEVMEV